MQFDHRRRFSRARRAHVHALAWLLPLAAGACGGPPSTQAAPGPDRTDANERTRAATAAAPAMPDTQQAQVLSHADGTLRVRLDDIAYAPLQQRALNEGDPQAWLDTLPPRFTQRVSVEEDGICEGGDRVQRHEDQGERNIVELRTCRQGDAPAFLTGFSFRDDVVAFQRDLRPGMPRAAVLAALGVSLKGAPLHSAPINGERPDRMDILEATRTIEVVNAEQNSILHLHFDDAGQLQQIEYVPYTG